MPLPENLKRNLLMADIDGDRGKTISPFHHSLNGGGIKIATVEPSWNGPHRLTCVFAGRTCNLVGNAVPQLNSSTNF